MTDHDSRTAVDRRTSTVSTRPQRTALERKTVAVYDTTTEGMTGWRFVATRRWIVYIVVAIAFATACVLLSNWQKNRGVHAAQYNSRVETNFYASPVPLASILPTLAAYDSADDWKPVSATGTYLTQDQLFVRTRPCGDDIGFEVLTPLKLATGQIFVVDRGCVGPSASDANYPAATPAPPSGTVNVVARIEPAEAQRGSTPSIPNQIETIDLAQVKSRIGGAVFTGAYGLLDSQNPAAATALTPIVTSPPTEGTALHWSYMIQWILIGAIAFWYLFFGMRSEFRRLNADDPEERARARARIEREARKRFTDGEIEDELLDGYVSLRRWGATGEALAVSPVPRPGGALGYTRAIEAPRFETYESDAPARARARRIAALPKVELHLHIEGTLEPELIFRLAERNGIRLPYATVDELRARYEFENLQQFLDLYYENMHVLRERDDFGELAYEYLARAAKAGVRHAEIFFDPQPHLSRGVPLETIVGGLVDGLETGEDYFGVTSSLIACFLRDRPTDESLAVLTELVETGAPIIGIGLDSTEIGNPPARYLELFDYAEANGLHRVAHAGEEGPAQYVADAIDLLGAERIDHGVHALDDPRLMRRLVADRVPLTLCPLSNVRLGGAASIEEHALPRFLEAGAAVTVNSDDPAYFGGYIDDNFAAVADAFSLSDETLALLARNAIDASFLPGPRKAQLNVQLSDWVATG